jgi:hypothetical protein
VKTAFAETVSAFVYNYRKELHLQLFFIFFVPAKEDS